MFSKILFFVTLTMDSLTRASSSKPNFIIFFADDVGAGDFQSFGHPTQERGPIDEMADEGMRFTKWYSGDSMCTPSRAALLTGRLPIRMGLVGPNRVFWQWDEGGLPKQEITIPEALLELGYSTGMVGKWHLGINERVVNDGNHLPHHHGFQFVGTNYPYGQNWKCDPKKFTAEEMSVKCFKYDNSTFIQQPTDMINSTAEMVTDAIHFIEDNSQKPFFLYVPFLQTHCSLFCSPTFCGSSRRGMWCYRLCSSARLYLYIFVCNIAALNFGLKFENITGAGNALLFSGMYGDNINEMSWAVGQILAKVKQLNIAQNTLAFFTSDNGPQLEMCVDGGSSGFLKGGKGSTWEGGIRMPAIAWWPGTIEAGSISHEVVSTVDLYATLIELAGGDATDDGVVRDSLSIVDVFSGSKSPHDFLFHYCSDRLMAVRYGSYKIAYVTQIIAMNLTTFCKEGEPDDDRITNLDCYRDSVISHDPPLIFDTDSDPHEDYPLNSEDYSDILNVVQDAVESHHASIKPVDSILGLKNEELQPCCNYPICRCNYDHSEVSSWKSEL